MKNGSCEHQHRFGEKNMEFCENVRALSTLVLSKFVRNKKLPFSNVATIFLKSLETIFLGASKVHRYFPVYNGSTLFVCVCSLFVWFAV